MELPEIRSLLLDKMAWLNSVISKNKFKAGNKDAFREYDEVLTVMRLAFQKLADVDIMQAKYERMEMMARYLNKENLRMEAELKKYEILREMKQKGTLEQELAKVDQYEEILLEVQQILETQRQKESDAYVRNHVQGLKNNSPQAKKPKTN